MNGFDILTRRDVIREMPERWKKQYSDWPDGKTFGDGMNVGTIRQQLNRLDTETCSRETIDAIIGNKSWTAIVCSVCEQDAEKAVAFHDYEDRVIVCCVCLDEAVAAVKGQGSEENIQ